MMRSIPIALFFAVLLFCPSVGANPYPDPDTEPIWIASPPIAPPHTPIGLNFSNATDDTLTLVSTAPWSLEDDQGNPVYTPLACFVLLKVPPGGSATWAWDQRNDLGNQVEPGDYIAKIGWIDQARGEAEAPITIVGGIRWEVMPDPVPEETITTLTFWNTSDDYVTLESSAPWEITDLAGNHIFAPMALPEPQMILPGEGRTWDYELRDDAMNFLDPGDYLAHIHYEASDGSGGTLPADAVEPFTITPAPDGEVVWMVWPRINGTEMSVAMTLTNATNDTIWIRDYAPWWIEDVDRNYVDSADMALLAIWPIPPGATMPWSWDEQYAAGGPVPGGRYYALIEYSRTNYPYTFEPVEIDFQLLDPYEGQIEPCLFVEATNYQIPHPAGTDVDFRFTNCAPTTVGMRCQYSWWIATELGIPIYWPYVLWAYTTFESLETFDFVWPETMDYTGESVPSGFYYACVSFTDERFLTEYIVRSQPIAVQGSQGIAQWLPPLYAPQTRIAPNPFGRETSISFTVAEEGTNVQLQVFDAAGRLVSHQVLGPHGIGAHTQTWLPIDRDGQRLAAGTYLCRIQLADSVAGVKMLVLD